MRTENVTLPTAFFRDLSEAESVQGVLDAIATWLPVVIDGERASITLATDDGEHLEVYSLGGNKAIPVGAVVPIFGTLVGQVYRERRTISFDEFGPADGVDAAMLYEGGLRCCLDAPLLSGGRCFGTLNIGHSQPRWFDDGAIGAIDAIARLAATSIRVHREVEVVSQLAETDPLTGVFNRRTFDRRMAESWEGFRRRGASFALAVLDLDDFKTVNDRYGHDVGDLVLCAAADVLRGCVRGDDVVARIGGEEFAVLLPGMPPESVRPWAERLRSTIASGTVRAGDDDVRYTTSVGVAVASESDADVAELYRRADRALYTAKAEGRDRVVSAVA